jgi:hypothetical protein
MQFHALSVAGLSEDEIHEVRAWIASRRAYRDEQFPERLCEHCNGPYRGPSLYCSHACATKDAT